MADADELDWEEWNPSQISFLHHMVAGSIAGLAEHVTLFPIDTIKTNMQCERCGSISPMQTWNCATRIVHNEGIFRLWRGVTAMFAACIPAHAAYFSVYESSKKILGADQAGHHPLKAAACGGLAAFSHDLFMTPFDLIKQRMQLGYYNSVVQCFRSVVKSEGFFALYVGMPTALIMNIPYGAIMVPVNESLRKILSPSGDYSFSTTMIAGSVAGGVAAAFTNPLDVIKTRLQTQNLEPCPNISNPVVSLHQNATGTGVGTGSIRTIATQILKSDKVLSSNTTILDNKSIPVPNNNSNNIINNSSNANEVEANPFRGIVRTAQRIITQEGYKGFLRGMVPRILTQAPAVAISWTAYESMKKFLVLNFSADSN